VMLPAHRTEIDAEVAPAGRGQRDWLEGHRSRSLRGALVVPSTLPRAS
jgi:hypothetical protein